MTYWASKDSGLGSTADPLFSLEENPESYSWVLFCHRMQDWTQQMRCCAACLLLQVCSGFDKKQQRAIMKQ